jgi:hypothetical protein
LLSFALATALGDSTGFVGCAYAVDFPADKVSDFFSISADKSDCWSGCYQALVSLSDDNDGSHAQAYQRGSSKKFLRWQPGNHSVFLDRSDTAGFWCLSTNSSAGPPVNASGLEVVSQAGRPWAAGPPEAGWDPPGVRVVRGRDSLLAVWAIGLRMVFMYGAY